MKIFLIGALCLATVNASLFSQHLLKSSKPHARIIGGSNARAGEFPFAAAIFVSKPSATLFCGGALLTNQWVITAAQCVQNATLFRIQLGSNLLNGKDDNRMVYSTDEGVVHPDFDPTTYDNDLGLIKLRLPVTFTDYIKPVTFLPVADIKEGAASSILGWGQTSDDVAGEINELQTVKISVLSNEECKLTYGNQVTDSMVCVDGNFNEGTCIGDSGSPMVQQISMGYTVLVGVSSFHSGNGCESPDPSGFTRVFFAKEWITELTGLQ